ncbi:hypothetical protein B0I33_105246 [Prauserella shujinwangii]|uniref:MYXO-CTERM domain-containing protein n=1 Tax=Prauserella shujinwangii TaxID=1453103 RepID=A0A2T0LV20_9PSEU|nr:hypothetical protein [Prauserella shujinwangii]PRX47666.1 hypothetical protein B0I33_105246 [Prauserella shujinwangii]
MQGRKRRTVAAGAAAFVLAGSAAFATPGTAAAETIEAGCGDTVTARPGDRIQTPFGLKTVTDGLTSLVGGLLGGLCKITVNVVDTVVEPVPVVGEPLASAVNGAVRDTTKSVTDTAEGVTGAITGSGSGAQPAPESGGGRPAPEKPGAGTGPRPSAGGDKSDQRPRRGPEPNSPLLLGGSGMSGLPGLAYLPTDFSTGYAPMRDYSGIPMATAGLFSPSPGIRYGGQIPGYSPEFGILGGDYGTTGDGGADDSVRNAGRAEALPAGQSGDGAAGATLPMLLAVLSLSGVAAALVRTWVLRRATAQ